MQEKELKVSNFNGKKYIEECLLKLEDPNLSAIERRRLEAYVDNFYLRNMDIQEKQSAILKENPKKQQKKQILTPKKIVITAAFASLVATTTFNGFKIYQRNESIKALNNYNKQYTMYEIKYGDTLTSIANSYYQTYPEEVRQYLSLNQLINEIKNSNHIKDKNYIKSGNKIMVPSLYILKAENEEEKYQK